jgi:pyrroloquinoline quinone (PQQ) biosynthesis protein C
MAFYDELLIATEVERNTLLSLPLIKLGATGQISHDAYVGFLTEAYHHVKHTVPLLMNCGARLPERYEWLREAIAEYIEEETGHQEWILNDIKACGADGEAVRRGKAKQPAELMVAYAYDMVNRVNPVGFFGMVLVLEGTSVQVATVAADAIKNSLGLNAKAMTYLTSHGALDVGHTDFYESLMNKVDDAQDQAMIVHAAKVFYKLYADIFRELADRYYPHLLGASA